MGDNLETQCFGCSSSLVEPYIRCAECGPPPVNICLHCFSRGLQLHQHHSDHKYEVVKNDFALFEGGWTAAEEIQLLDAVADCGIGNWSDVAHQVQSKTRSQCERHYMKHYLSQPVPTLPQMPEADQTYYPCPVPYRACEDPPRPVEGSALQFEMSGYMPARGDFMVEHDNYAEMTLRDVDFVKTSDPLLIRLNLEVVDVYQNVLRERQRRKRIIRDHGLINLSKNIVHHRKYDKTIGAVNMDTLKAFRRLMSPIDWDKFLEGLHYSRELQQDIHRLQEHREAGIIRFQSAAVYNRLKHRREDQQNDKGSRILGDVLALIQNDSTYSHWGKRQSMISQLSKGPPAHSVANAVRRSSVPLDIVGMPNFDKLSENEKELCSSARLVPESYLEFKTLLVGECLRNGYLRLAQARNMIKIDVNKTRKLYDFLIQEGHIIKDPPVARPS